MITYRAGHHRDDHLDGCEYMMKCVRGYEYTTNAVRRYMTDCFCIYSIQIYISKDIVTTCSDARVSVIDRYMMVFVVGDVF